MSNMSKIQKVRIIYENGEIGELLQGVGTGYRTWSWWANEYQTRELNTSNYNTRYVDTVGENQKRRFNIHCESCRLRNCELTVLKRQPSGEGGSFRDDMKSFHVHWNGLHEPGNHVANCGCVTGRSNYGNSSVKKRTVVSSVRLYITDHDYKLNFTFELPKMYVKDDVESKREIDKKSKQENYLEIRKRFAEETKDFAVLAKEDPEHNIISGTLNGLPTKSEIRIIHSNKYLKGNPNIDKIGVKFLKIVNWICWCGYRRKASMEEF